MSHSVLRRYTPPTCTLEIMANNSPLSRWAGQPVLKQLRFQLTLDDPTLPQEKWIKIQGDRVQLDTLHEVVSGYVQAFLEQSHNRLSGTAFASPLETESAIAVLPSLPAVPALTMATASVKELSLIPRGMLTHELRLGSLATVGTEAIVTLSALQLFDLANALDAYASDVVALPDLQRSRGLTLASFNWGQIAATGLIVVGLSASVAKIIDSSMKPASPTASQGASSSDQQIATQLPPTAEIQPSIVSKQTLPPPPPLGSTVPGSPGLPTIAVPSPSVTTGANAAKPPTGTVTVSPPAPSNTRLLPSSKTAGQVAIVPQNGNVSNRAAKMPAPTPTKPLALNREFAAAPPSQPPSAASRLSASEGSPSADQAGTAFDTIPQVAEARQYFQQHWSPPEGLTQTLEYTLLVGANGSIQRTIPLGQASGDYIDRTGMPLAGEPFVSAIRGERNAKIRLVLSPDGTVKTFLEGFY